MVGAGRRACLLVVSTATIPLFTKKFRTLGLSNASIEQILGRGLCERRPLLPSFCIYFMMSTYILTLLAASLAAAVIELLSPKGEGGRIASHVRLVAGLFLLVMLLEPLQEGLNLLRSAAAGELTIRLPQASDIHDTADYGYAFWDTVEAVSRGEVEAWVTEILEAEFSIPPSDCVVEAVCERDGDGLVLRELRIGLRGKYMLKDPHPIEAYFSERLGCPCYVTAI